VPNAQRPTTATLVSLAAIVAVTCGCRDDAPRPSPPPKTLAESGPASVAEARLVQLLTEHCRDPAEPWAAVHGALALGAGFTVSDGRPAVAAVIADHVEIRAGRAWFPAFKSGRPIENHPGLFTKVALEVGASLDNPELRREGIDAERLSRDALSRLDTSGSLMNMEWLLEVLFRTGEPARARRAAEVAMARLEREQSYLEPLLADRAANIARFEKKARMVAGQPVPDAIHRYFCGGNHLFQACILAVSKGLVAKGRQRLSRQLDILLFRGQAEGSYWRRKAREVAQHPKLGEAQRAQLGDLFAAQRLKITGHVLESWEKARRAGLGSPEASRAKVLDELRAELASAIALLDQRGLFARIPALAKSAGSRQLRQDLLGDSAHALNALRLARRPRSP
jgi:hypothetical protein